MHNLYKKIVFNSQQVAKTITYGNTALRSRQARGDVLI